MYSLRPGKKVRILQHFNNIVDDFTHITVVCATKDSVGIILSYEEYSAHEYELFFSDLEKRSSQDATLRHAAQDVHLRHLAWVKSGIEARTHFPIRFEEFVPLPEQDYAKLQREYTIVDMACQVGATVILPTEAFVIIAET